MSKKDAILPLQNISTILLLLFFTNLAACARRFLELGALGSAIIVLVDMSSLLEVIDTLRSADTIVC